MGRLNQTAATLATPFKWDDRKLDAARLLGEGDLGEKEIAAKLGMPFSTLWRWKQHAAFMERVRASAIESEDAAVSRGFGRKARRVKALSAHVDLLDRIVEERGEANAKAYPGVPGAATGLLTYEENVVKTTTRSFRGTHITEEVTQRKWSVDASLIRERRALLMQISKEVGGIVDRTMNLNVNVDANGSDSEPPADLGALSGAIMGRLMAPNDGERAAGVSPNLLPE
jgi:hypothetical protein